MELVRIEKDEIDYFYSLLENDFCFEERKTKEGVLKNFSNPSYVPCFIKKDGNILGYFCYWELGSFLFGEHFAILKELRNHTLGIQFLKEFLNYTKLVKKVVYKY